MVRTARSPLRILWAGLYRAVARLAALAVAPPGTETSVYLTGSLASGDPVYGLSDIDLVAITSDESESERARKRFERLCSVLPPLRQLIPDFSTYHAEGLARILRGSYLINGLADGAAVFRGPDAVRDEKGLLERPGLYGARDWQRLRGPARAVQSPDSHHPLLASWLELQYRWQWAFHTPHTDAGERRLVSTLAAEAARIWLWLARGERHESGGVPLERALRLIAAEGHSSGPIEVASARRRSPKPDVARLRSCFVDISCAISDLVNARSAEAGVTEVNLLGAAGGGAARDGVPLLDWRALALPMLDWRQRRVPWMVEERLVPLDGDPADPAALEAAAARAERGLVPVLRRGSLLIEPTSTVLGHGWLRAAQCRASDPVSVALLDGRTEAEFPQTPGWSAHDWARRAVAEHRAWLFPASPEATRVREWIRSRPPIAPNAPAALELLLSAARAALFLESIEAGSPELPVRLVDVVAVLSAREAGFGADAGEAHAVLEACRREKRRLPRELVLNFRRRVKSLPPYAWRTAHKARTMTSPDSK